MSDNPSSLAITWSLSTLSGYGIYGLQIVQQFLRQGGTHVVLTKKPSVTDVDPLLRSKLNPIFELAIKLDQYLADHLEAMLTFKHAVLHGSSSDFAGFLGQDRVWGQPNVACCAIEHLIFGEHGKRVVKNYDMFIAISKWNAEFLKSLNVGPVHLCYQGIDATQFYPAPRNGLFRDRFVIFSGGKFEFRKGQDIVVAAFKRFYARHPDALLVTCWQNLLLSDPHSFQLAGHVDNVPLKAPDYGLEITPWLQKQGLPKNSFVDIPFTNNLMMPNVLRECDVAIFPNRCEGGTNLVAMEAMACGIPTFVAYNTGQKDLVDLIGCGSFSSQKAVKSDGSMLSVEDWGETDCDEVLTSLEEVYNRRDESQRQALKVAARMKDWQWGPLNEKLLHLVHNTKADLV